VNIKISRKLIVLLSALAFAAVVYFILPRLTGSRDRLQGEGLGAFKVETFEGETGWAYRIYQGKDPVVEQNTVPGIAGNTGFKTQDDAQRTGNLVKLKLDSGIFPPTVTRHELDSLGVSY
jgi:hypothetical protein